MPLGGPDLPRTFFSSFRATEVALAGVFLSLLAGLWRGWLPAPFHLALLAVFSSLLAWHHFSVLRPITNLSRKIQAYRNGDFTARVTVTRDNEVGYLEASFNDLAENTSRLVAELRALDGLKSEFLSTVSHELRTPLTSIGGYAQVLRAGDAGPLSDVQREFLEIIENNVERLANLVNDLLDVEKLESGGIAMERRPEDLAPILKACRETLGVLADRKGLSLRLEIPDSLGPVLGDRDQLLRIFVNLISNAIKYTPSGSVVVEAEQNAIGVSVRVRDTGVGLSEEEQARLFEKFYRARSGLTSEEGGSGLGLVIVRKLIEAHHGTVTVDSAPGRGTTFQVNLPRSSAELAALGTDWLSGGSARGSFAVWCVGGTGPERQRMEAVLRGRGPAMLRFFDRVGAVPSPGQPELAILDLGNGESAAAGALRARLAPRVPILVLGAPVLESPTGGGAAGIAYLPKPFGDLELVGAIERLMSESRWRLLIADPDTDGRILLKRSLLQRGFEVDDVESGQNLIRRLEQEDYDLVLMDLGLRDLPGLEVLKMIRRNPRWRDLPIFAMLGEGAEIPVPELLLASGAHQFVGKYRGIGGVVDAVLAYFENDPRTRRAGRVRLDLAR